MINTCSLTHLRLGAGQCLLVGVGLLSREDRGEESATYLACLRVPRHYTNTAAHPLFHRMGDPLLVVFVAHVQARAL